MRFKNKEGTHMELEQIGTLVTVALVVFIVIFLFKKMVALALACGAILILFNVGFVMNGTEIREWLQLDNYMNQEHAEAVEGALNDFDSKRDEYGVIDTDKVGESIENAMINGTVILIEGLGHIDIVQFASTVSDKLLAAGMENVDRTELENAIREALSGIKETDVTKIADMIEQNLENEENPEE
jgi:hypothetical protein